MVQAQKDEEKSLKKTPRIQEEDEETPKKKVKKVKKVKREEEDEKELESGVRSVNPSLLFCLSQFVIVDIADNNVFNTVFETIFF